MINPYLIIISLFIIAGLATTVWGWSIIARGRKMRHWPSVDGVIEQSAATSEIDDLLPHIGYRYAVAGQTYRGVMQFQAGISPTPEFAAGYVEKYPAGARVQVYYDPARPEHSTLESGPNRGDWLVLALGLGAVLLGVVLMIGSG